MAVRKLVQNLYFLLVYALLFSTLVSGQTYGNLSVDITSPTDPTSQALGTTFRINATINCTGTGTTCGTVGAYARWNHTTGPEILVSQNEGTQPFYIDLKLTQGSNTAFTSIAITLTDTERVDDDSFLIAYDNSTSNDGMFKVINLNGTEESIVTFTTNDTNSYIRADMLDNDSVVIIYQDATDGNDGKFVVYNIDGTLETAITEFTDNTSIGASVAALDNNTFVIAYVDSGDGNDAKYIVYNENGTNESGIVEFETTSSSATAVTGVDNDTFAIAHRAGTRNYLTIFNVNGTTELSETELYNEGSQLKSIQTEMVDNDSIIIGTNRYDTDIYCEVCNEGTAFIVYNIDGTEETTYTDTNSLSGSTYSMDMDVVDENSVVFVFGQSTYARLSVYNINGSAEISQTSIFTDGRAISTAAVDSDTVAVSFYESTTAYYELEHLTMNPQEQTMVGGDSYNASWLVYANGNRTCYELDVFFNSSHGNSNVPDNDTTDITFCINPIPQISDATINDTSIAVRGTTVRVNATITDEDNNIDDVILEVTPPLSDAYNTTPSSSGDEYYNESTTLDEGGIWRFRFFVNDTDSSSNTSWAEDEASNIYIDVNNTAPTTNSLILNSTNGLNTTSENLTAYATFSDTESDNVSLNYDWRIANRSIMSLNMNFNNKNWSNITRDYSSFENHGNVTATNWKAYVGYNGTGAYEFEGGGHIIVADNESLDFDEELSIEIWINLSQNLRTITIDSSDNTAWDQGGAIISVPGNSSWTSSSSAERAKISADDSDWWESKVTTTHNDTDQQLYRFYLEEGEQISNIFVNWSGYGEDETGYNTTLYIYNFDSSSYEELDQAFLSSDGMLSGNQSLNFEDYINTSDHVYIAATAKHHDYPPTVSESSRTPANETSLYSDTISWTLNWPDYVDWESDTAEYYAERFSGKTCSGAAQQTYGWSTTSQWTTTGLTGNQNYSWRIFARSQGYTKNSSSQCWWFDTYTPPPSSCPVLYFQEENGSFTYITDMANGVLGLRNDFFAKYYNRSYFKVPNKPVNGEFVYKIRELYDEIAYIDDVKLLLIHHDENVEIVHTGQRSAVRKNYPKKILTASNPILPTLVLDKNGKDVTDKFVSVDNKAAKVDLYEDDYWDLYFENIEGNENSKLILERWTYPSKAEEQANHPFKGNLMPYIEVINSSGQWEKIKEFMYGTADFHQVAIELGNIFLTDNKTIRLHTGKYHPLSEQVIDRIRYDESEPKNYTITEIKPTFAELSDGKLATYKEHNLVSRGIVEDDTVEGEIKFYGNYTKFGNVLPLMTEQDDMFVVMRRGDMLIIKFKDKEMKDEKRTVILSSKTWFRIDKSQFNTNTYPDPLPFTGMTEYPYNTSIENYPQSRKHQKYIKEWNTRVYLPPEERLVEKEIVESDGAKQIIKTFGRFSETKPSKKVNEEKADGSKQIIKKFGKKVTELPRSLNADYVQMEINPRAQLVFKDGSYALEANNETIFATINDNTMYTNYSSGWHHIVMTYDRNGGANDFKLYIDNDLKSQSDINEFINITTKDLIIGNLTYGVVDNVRIYNRSLSEEQISALYNNRTDLIVSQELVTKENWTVCVTPSDRIDSGVTNCSSVLRIAGNNAPEVDTIIINTTYGQNRTSENISVFVNGTDSNQETIFYNFDWRVNGTSIAIVNYNFDVNNSAGTNKTRDYTTYENNGTSYGGTTWIQTSGWNDTGAYSFDGINDYINTSMRDVDTVNNGFTFSAWLKTNDVNMMIYHACADNCYSDSNAPYARINGSGNIEAYIGDYAALVASNTDVNDSEWHFVTITINSSNDENSIYVDGTLDNSGTLVSAGPAGGHALILGYDSGGFADNFNGTMDSVRIYNRTLTPEQIMAIYNNDTHIILTNETKIGDNWTACITPNDLDDDGNTTCSNTLKVLSLDTSPPIITDVTNSSITNESVVITWNTDEIANSSVIYGTTLAMTDGSSGNATLKVNHSFSISGLDNVTTYYYNVTSCDASQNCNTSGPFSFTTFQTHPLCGGTITESMNLTRNLTVNGTCYTVTGSNIYINGRGLTITGNGTLYGFYETAGANNVTIRDLKIKDFAYGVQWWNGHSLKVLNNTISNTTTRAVDVPSSSDDVEVKNNRFNLTSGGYAVYFSSGTTLCNGTIESNNATGTGGYPIYSNCWNSRIKNNNLTFSISAGSPTMVTILGKYSNITENYVRLDHSGGFDLIRGIRIYTAHDDNKIHNNTIILTGSGSVYGHGIFVGDTNADRNIISFNNIKVITEDTLSVGIQIDESEDNIAVNNTINSSGYCLRLADTPVQNNTFERNTLTHCGNLHLYFNSGGMHNTSLIDQEIWNYSLDTSGGGGHVMRILDTSNGEIQFLDGINGSGTNFSKDIQIGDNYAFVNVSNVLGFNVSANVTLYNLNYNQKPLILRDGFVCSDCEVLSYSNSEVIFNVTGWSNYTTSPTARLEIWDDTESEGINYTNYTSFYANYTNITSNISINGTGVFCEITFLISGSWTTEVNMSFNTSSKIYVLNRTFPSPNQEMEWNVTCNGSIFNYEVLNSTDLANITGNVTDTCTHPAINSDWNVNASDTCEKTDQVIDLGTGIFTLYDTGFIRLINTTIYASDFRIEAAGGPARIFLHNSSTLVR